MTQPEQFWPHGARLAVTISMQFEAGGQPISGASGPITEPILPGFPTSGRTAFMSMGRGKAYPGCLT